MPFGLVPDRAGSERLGDVRGDLLEAIPQRVTVYLDEIHLRNFRCFKDAVIPFSKITLLLGANSAGKSSVINGLLAALQSDEFPLSLSPNGELANLGDYRSIVHGHGRDTSVGVGLRFREHRHGTVSIQGTFEYSGRVGMPSLASARISDDSFGVSIRKEDRVFRADWTYSAESDAHHTNVLKNEELRSVIRSVAQLALKSEKQRSSESGGMDPLAPPPPVGKFTFRRNSEFFGRISNPRHFVLAQHLLSLGNTLKSFGGSFNHLGSFRLEPQRSYFLTSRGDLKVRRDGSNYIEQIAEWQSSGAGQLKRLISSLRSLGLLDYIRARRMRSGLFEMAVKSAGAKQTAGLADVGFGVGQILPMLVADVQLGRRGTLAVSQPEIHLHPSVQAELADYMVREAKARGMRYIVETHSEYLINRLRLLIAKGTLAPADLSVVYLSNDGSQSTPHLVEFTPSGRIQGAPQDFFQTYMMDVMNLALEAQSE